MMQQIRTLRALADAYKARALSLSDAGRDDLAVQAEEHAKAHAMAADLLDAEDRAACAPADPART